MRQRRRRTGGIYMVASTAALVAVAVFFQALSAFGAGAGAGRPVLKGEGFTVYYDESVKHHAEAVKTAYPQLKADIEKKIGWKLKSRPSIHLIGDEREFRRMGGGGSIAAFALIGRARIVVDLSSFDRYISLNHTLRHELTHLLLHDHIRRDLPDWLEEGICEWAAGPEPAGIDPIQGFLTGFAMYRNGPPMARLRDFSTGSTGIQMAYIQSGEFIRFIESRYGSEGIRKILSGIKAGAGVDRAFRAAISKSPAGVEAEWRGELAERAKWLIAAEKAALQAGKVLTASFQKVAANPGKFLFYLLVLCALAASLRAISRIIRR